MTLPLPCHWTNDDHNHDLQNRNKNIQVTTVAEQITTIISNGKGIVMRIAEQPSLMLCWWMAIWSIIWKEPLWWVYVWQGRPSPYPIKVKGTSTSIDNTKSWTREPTEPDLPFHLSQITGEQQSNDKSKPLEIELAKLGTCFLSRENVSTRIWSCGLGGLSDEEHDNSTEIGTKKEMNNIIGSSWRSHPLVWPMTNSATK